MLAAANPDERAARDPAGACIADECQEPDYARFTKTATAIAALLADAGLRRGDVLAIMLPNRVEMITSRFAAWQLGPAVTAVSPALREQEARHSAQELTAADTKHSCHRGRVP
jgi:long-chain acyl-CoA synthetase